MNQREPMEMSDINQQNTEPPQIILAKMMSGYAITQLIYVAAKLGIADLLKDGPKSSEELSLILNVHSQSLYRVMRGLTCVGLFAEDNERRFNLKPLGQFFRSEVQGSLRPLAISTESAYNVWKEVLHTVQTGETGFHHVYGMDRYQFLEQNSEAAEVFNEAMAGLAVQVSNAVVSSYDFSLFHKVVDVGGGSGTLLVNILKATPHLHGLLLESAMAIESAKRSLETVGLMDRCEIRVGDFFKSVPAGGDVYILANVIHNWDDDRSMTILKNCRNAMTMQNSKLLLVEMFMQSGEEAASTPYQTVMTDLQMMMMTGGRERTKDEYQSLLEKAGFRLINIRPTFTLHHLIESEPC